MIVFVYFFPFLRFDSCFDRFYIFLFLYLYQIILYLMIVFFYLFPLFPAHFSIYRFGIFLFLYLYPIMFYLMIVFVYFVHFVVLLMIAITFQSTSWTLIVEHYIVRFVQKIIFYELPLLFDLMIVCVSVLFLLYFL